jgi:hypothetical protein
MSITSEIQSKTSLRVAAVLGIMFLAVQVALSIFAPAFEAHKVYYCVVLSLVGLVAGCAGWACGLFLSPIGSQVNGAQKVLAGFAVFWSGVVVSHLGQLTQLFDGWQKSAATPATKIELLFGLGVFLFALCVTFNTRFDQADKV